MSKYLPLLFVILISPGANAQGVHSSYLIKAGKVYDSRKSTFSDNQEIYIVGNKIMEIGQNLEVPQNVTIIDASNSTVTPGLIDAHTHLFLEQKVQESLELDMITNTDATRLLRAVDFAKSYLQAGFTTIRDLGNSGQYLDVELRNAINKGQIEGPKMFVSGPIISSYDGQFGGLYFEEHNRITRKEYRTVNGIDDARLAIKEHIVQFVDVIKILAFGNILALSLEELQAIVETAHSNRMKVTVHADRDWVVHKAIEAGVDGIEHGYGFKESTLKKMAEKDIYLVPTLSSVDVAVAYYKMMGEIKEPEELKDTFKSNQEMLMKAHELGVLLVAGSDAYFDVGIPRGDLAKHTLIAYHDAGLPAAAILKTATFNASIALNRKGQIGIIESGAFADLCIFEGDLEKDFRKSLFNVQLVIKDGKVYYQNGSLDF